MYILYNFEARQVILYKLLLQYGYVLTSIYNTYVYIYYTLCIITMVVFRLEILLNM